MIDFVVDLVEERVDLGSQFSESILEHWQQRVSPFFHEVFYLQR